MKSLEEENALPMPTELIFTRKFKVFGSAENISMAFQELFDADKIVKGSSAEHWLDPNLNDIEDIDMMLDDDNNHNSNTNINIGDGDDDKSMSISFSDGESILSKQVHPTSASSNSSSSTSPSLELLESWE
eukprot:292038_1